MRIVSFALIIGIVGCASLQPISAANIVTFNEKVLYSFCSQRNCTDGQDPVASLIDVNGRLYGITEAGGSGFGCGHPSARCGTVFSLNPSTGVEKVLFSFCTQANCAGGAYPTRLIAANGVLYGADGGGGSYANSACSSGCGTVFSLDPRRGALTVPYTFCGQPNCSDGAFPSGLIDLNGLLFGTTGGGGTGAGCGQTPPGCGTVFSLDPMTGSEKVLYSFAGAPDGAYPNGLIVPNGKLYGSTGGGGRTGCGKYGCGTVFAIDMGTGDESVLYSFCSQKSCADGWEPQGNLIEVNGILYGTTFYGGANGCGNTTCGTVFSVDPSTGAETVLHSFQGGADGEWPVAGPIAVKDKLYGTTWFGGTYHSGAVFGLDLKTGAEAVVYSFCSQANCTDGDSPTTGLIELNGNLYGTTSSGGAGTDCPGSAGCGTVFVLEKKS